MVQIGSNRSPNPIEALNFFRASFAQLSGPFFYYTSMCVPRAVELYINWPDRRSKRVPTAQLLPTGFVIELKVDVFER